MELMMNDMKITGLKTNIKGKDMLSQDYFEKQSSADEMEYTKGIRTSKHRFRMAIGLGALLASVAILHAGFIPAYAEETEDVAEETIVIEQPAGSASVVEVIKDQDGTETNLLTTSTDPVDEHENDMPSITVTETFSEDPHNDPGLKPDSISVTLTDSGDAVAPECMAEAFEKSSDIAEPVITSVETPADTEAGTPATTTWTKVTVTESQNAIQKAVDDALKRVTDTSIKSVTITVADGEYNGDVTISSDKVGAGKLSDDFTLYILSEGSHAPADESTNIIDKTTINAEAGTGANVNGAIIINNINTILVGLYFSKGRTIDVTGTDKNKITVFGTKGNDNISLNIKGDVEAKVDSGAGDDTVGFVQTSGKIDANIETGAGEDYVSASSASTVDSQSGSLNINTADGDDVIQIDTSLANAIGSVNLFAGDGDDTLDLIGILAGTDNRISKDASSITLFNDSSKKLVINGIPNIETFTDSLENKETKNITSLLATDIQSFTNYRYTGDFDNELTANWTTANLFLTKLILEGDGKDVKIGNLNVPRANLVIKAKELTISGIITALDIKINAIDTDDLYKLDTTQFAEKTGLPPVGEDGELSGSFMDFYSKALVTVEDTAKLIASKGNISIEATTRQTHDLLDLFGQTGIDDDLNFLNIKVCESGINLKGALDASRNIILKTAATVMIDVSNDMLASLFIPLAFGLAVSDVHIDIESANLKSGGDITADATSDIKVKGEASTGSLPVAIALSIGVSDTHIKVTGNSILDAGGNVELNADLNLQTEASSKKGDMNGTSGGFIAVEIGVTDSYVKVTDNTNIIAGKDVSLNSNGSITGVATATSAGDGEAADSVDGQTNKIKGLLTSVRDALMENVGAKIRAMLNGTVEQFGGKAHAIKVDNTQNGTVTAPSSANNYEFFSEDAFADGVTYYTYNKSNNTYTAVAAGAAKDPKTAYYTKAEPVKIAVNGNEGYVPDVVKISYLPKGASDYADIPFTVAADGTYSFEMPEYDVTILATFKKGTAQNTNALDDPGFDGVGDLFNEATSSAVTDESDKRQTVNSTADDAVTIKIELSDDPAAEPGTSAFGLTDDIRFETGKTYYTKGADGKYTIASVTEDDYVTENTYYERNGAILTQVISADLGKEILVTVNPVEGYALKVGSLTATYKFL